MLLRGKPRMLDHHCPEQPWLLSCSALLPVASPQAISLSERPVAAAASSHVRFTSGSVLTRVLKTEAIYW